MMIKGLQRMMSKGLPLVATPVASVLGAGREYGSPEGMTLPTVYTASQMLSLLSLLLS